MEGLGPNAFWLVIGTTFVTMALYAAYRMTQRVTPTAQETEAYLGVLPTASAVAVEAAGTWSAEQAAAEDETDTQTTH